MKSLLTLPTIFSKKETDSDTTTYNRLIKPFVICLPIAALNFIVMLLRAEHLGKTLSVGPVFYSILLVSSIIITSFLLIRPKKLYLLISLTCLTLASYFITRLVNILFFSTSKSAPLHALQEELYLIAVIYFIAFLIPNIRLGEVITSSFTIIFLTISGVYLVQSFFFSQVTLWHLFYSICTIMLATSIFQCLAFTFFRFRKNFDSTRTNELLANQLARRDKLTGLPNRLMLQEELELLTNSTNVETSAFFFIDIDGFKSINDSLGHRVGDELLKNIAKRFTSIVEKNNQAKERTNHKQDFVARISGDEFVYIARDVKTSQEAEIVAKELLETFKLPFSLSGQQVTITSSIGFCFYPEHGTDSSSLLNKADIAMYSAKQAGKNTYCSYKAHMTTEAEERTILLKDLRAAISQNEFELYFQPIINLKDSSIEKFEALIRWNHPEKGLIPPNDFIPIAEQAGLIVPIDRWVLKEACKTANAWQSFLPNVAVTVNMSAAQLPVPDLVDNVLQTLDQTGLQAELLEIEVTESVIVDSLSLSNKPLSQLRDHGIKTAIDDFGTGYSSLQYLQELLADTVKIDRSFTSKLDGTHTNVQFSQKILEVITELSEFSGKQVVAEGIETIEQLQKLKHLGCHLGQGYYFSRPIPYREFTTLLNSPLVLSPENYQDILNSNVEQDLILLGSNSR